MSFFRKETNREGKTGQQSHAKDELRVGPRPFDQSYSTVWRLWKTVGFNHLSSTQILFQQLHDYVLLLLDSIWQQRSSLTKVT